MSQLYQSKLTIAFVLQLIAGALYFMLTGLVSGRTVAATLSADLIYGLGAFLLALTLYLFSYHYKS